MLGLDWPVVLTSPHLHSSTVLVALRMLVALLSNASILLKFREASSNGGWLTNLQQVTNKQGLVLGVCLSSQTFYLELYTVINISLLHCYILGSVFQFINDAIYCRLCCGQPVY